MGGEAHAKKGRLQYGRRLYRLLSAALLACTPAMLAAPAGLAQQLRQLAQRLAALAFHSCLAVHGEYAARRAVEAGRAGALALMECDYDGALLSTGDVRLRLRVSGQHGGEMLGGDVARAFCRAALLLLPTP